MDEFTGAIYQVAHEYGLKRLSPDLGVTEQTLRNKLNLTGDHTLTLAQYYQMVRFTKDVRAVQPLLDEIGMQAIKVSKPDEDQSLFDLILSHQAAFGGFAATVRDALADGKVDARERAELKQAMQAEINALCDAMSALDEMSQPREVKR